MSSCIKFHEIDIFWREKRDTEQERGQTHAMGNSLKLSETCTKYSRFEQEYIIKVGVYSLLQ